MLRGRRLQEVVNGTGKILVNRTGYGTVGGLVAVAVEVEVWWWDRRLEIPAVASCQLLFREVAAPATSPGSNL